MKGTVIKRGQKWSVVVDVGRGSDGRRIRKWHSGFDRKRDAEEGRIEILSRLHEGTYVEPSKVTLGEYLSRWLNGRVNLAETTKVSYRYEVQRVGSSSSAIGPSQNSKQSS